MPPSSEGTGVIVGDCVLVVFTSLWTALRIYSRKHKGVQLMVEDYLHMGALVGTRIFHVNSKLMRNCR